MAKAQFAVSMLAKTALLWLTAALIFASLFGAMLSARPDRPGLSFSQGNTVVVEAETETTSETR